MKLLFVVPSFYDARLPKKVKTGQAIIASELCSNFSEKPDVLISGYPVKGIDLGYADILSTGMGNLIKYVRIKDIKEALSIIDANLNILGYRQSIKEGIKSVFYKTLARKFERLTEKHTYDIVAIHDFDQGNLEVLKKCVLMKLKCVVTLHMYVGKNSTLVERIYQDRAKREEYLLMKTDVPITVVSSGLKRRILQDYVNVPPERITVIPNGTRLPEVGACGVSVKRDSSIEDTSTEDTASADTSTEGCATEGNRKLFLCIGTISDRKNQIQLLHALDYLPKNIRDQVKVLFIGEDRLGGKLQEEITKGGYQDVAEYVGAVEHEKMASYFRSAFAVVSTSLNEAFGLTFIEGFAYGLPALFFDDIDAVDELYNQNAVELICRKQCYDIAIAIKDVVNKIWNEQVIKQHSKKFDIREVAKEYERIYKYISCSAVH